MPVYSLILICLFFMVLVGGLITYRRSMRTRVCDAFKCLLVGFESDQVVSNQSYEDLFKYFVQGYSINSSLLGAYASYSGRFSYNGSKMDRLEGFSRVAPLIASWLKGGRPVDITLTNGKKINLVSLLKNAILAGTNPNSKEYWGKIKHWSQAIVEAPDIALSVWLSKKHIWDKLNSNEKKNISDWLIQVNSKGIPDNNWRLFVVQVNLTLKSLGEPFNIEEVNKNFDRIKEFYHGDGWFKDGESPEGPGFDYYNAWGFHYHLQWIKQISPGFETQFIDKSFREFIKDYRFFIGPDGFPIMGRSACYRMAAPVPHIFAQDTCPDLISPGQSRRALDTIWQYFIKKGALSDGNVTQGYFDSNYSLLEDYSGPASCLWSLRSLIAAFALPVDHVFWNSDPEPLPVEIGDYQIKIKTTGWTLNGNHSTNKITIVTSNDTNPMLVEQSAKNRILEVLSQKPRRPKNIEAKYLRSSYDSIEPYGIDCPDQQSK